MRPGLLHILFLCALCAVAHAATPTVGPLDGKTVESLPALASPVTTTERMPDFSFPKALEENGDLTSALFAWQRLAHEFPGPDRARALLAIARLQQTLGNSAAAALTWQTFAHEYPTHPRAEELAFRQAQLTTGAAQQAVLQKLAQKPTRTAWDDAALYTRVWDEAQTRGLITNTYGLEKAQLLQTKLAMLAQQSRARTATAAAVSLLPGAGLLFLNHNSATGGLMLFMWAVLGLAFLSACRHRHYAYALLFAMPFAAIWLNAPVAAVELARQQAVTARHTALASMVEFQPTIPTSAPDVPPAAPSYQNLAPLPAAQPPSATVSPTA
ncbi:MAG: hypothetical protein GC129_00305 [Proteobacteria bacterium]|nr:hypothetical protein [Pseudomonadota bacterium]